MTDAELITSARLTFAERQANPFASQNGTVDRKRGCAGWLINPLRKVVEVYRSVQEQEIHERPTSVQGDGPVTGFYLVMARIWG